MLSGGYFSLRENRVMRAKTIIKIILTIGITFVVLAMLYHTTKAMPEGTSLEGKTFKVADEDVDFLYDLTYVSGNGSKVIEQEIFKNVFEIVDNAEKMIVIDMFLFNTDYGNKETFIPITTELTNKLIKKKLKNPEISITFITDEINNFYGSYEAEHITRLRESGINVVITDLSKLRDSNPIYSGFWRIFLQWFGVGKEGKLSHPLGNKDYNVSVGAWMKLLNTKANHRKVIIADSNDTIVSLVTSGNPHEASSMHSNVGIVVKKHIWKDILIAEQSVARFSGSEIAVQNLDFAKQKERGEIQVQLLTEGKIKKSLLENIRNTESNDSIDIAMFYLSDREIVKSLLKSSERGVNIRLILDPNKDAFAREKNGIPNRQVAHELVEKSKGKIQVRWYDTKGEQFHTKMMIIRSNGKTIIYLGSANLTRRNIGDLNGEADFRVEAPQEAKISLEIYSYYERIWNNEGADYTLDFSAYYDDSSIKYLIYLFQEGSGLSTF